MIYRGSKCNKRNETTGFNFLTVWKKRKGRSFPKPEPSTKYGAGFFAYNDKGINDRGSKIGILYLVSHGTFFDKFHVGVRFNANVGSLVVMLCIILWVYSHWNFALSLIIVTGLSGR